MKSLLEKDIFNEMIVAHEIPFDMIPKSMRLQMISLSILLLLTLFHKHREHFVH